MLRKMEQLEVYISDTNNICLKQNNPLDDNSPDLVILSPDQAGLVIEWIKEAMTELKIQ